MRRRPWPRMGKTIIARRWSTRGQVPEYRGVGRPPAIKRAHPASQYLQVVKTQAGSRLIGVTIKVIYGDPATVPDVVGAHTAYVERINLTSAR